MKIISTFEMLLSPFFCLDVQQTILHSVRSPSTSKRLHPTSQCKIRMHLLSVQLYLLKISCIIFLIQTHRPKLFHLSSLWTSKITSIFIFFTAIFFNFLIPHTKLDNANQWEERNPKSRQKESKIYLLPQIGVPQKHEAKSDNTKDLVHIICKRRSCPLECL